MGGENGGGTLGGWFVVWGGGKWQDWPRGCPSLLSLAPHPADKLQRGELEHAPLEGNPQFHASGWITREDAILAPETRSSADGAHQDGSGHIRSSNPVACGTDSHCKMWDAWALLYALPR